MSPRTNFPLDKNVNPFKEANSVSSSVKPNLLHSILLLTIGFSLGYWVNSFSQQLFSFPSLTVEDSEPQLPVKQEELEYSNTVSVSIDLPRS